VIATPALTVARVVTTLKIYPSITAHVQTGLWATVAKKRKLFATWTTHARMEEIAQAVSATQRITLVNVETGSVEKTVKLGYFHATVSRV